MQNNDLTTRVCLTSLPAHRDFRTLGSPFSPVNSPALILSKNSSVSLAKIG